MRKPTKVRCNKSARYPRGEKYTGSVEYRGRQKWVGTFATRREWNDEAKVQEAELIAQVEGRGSAHVPTVEEFAGLTAGDDGRVVRRPGVAVNWPWTHRRNARKESTLRRYEEAMRPFIRSHGDRRVDSFGRQEARAIADSVGAHTSQALRRFFADVIDDEKLTGRNPFGGLGRRTGRRLDDPDFEVASDEEFEAFLRAALATRSDDYRLVQHGIVLVEGESAMRPSEIFAVEWSRLKLGATEGQIHVVQQVDDCGAITPVKNCVKRFVPLTRRAVAAIREMPRLSNRWVFPAPRGGLMKDSQWSPHWTAIRATAGDPEFEFYELKHRAITWMVTPEPDGLGMAPVDVAEIVGHTDGGATIAKYYLKLDQRKVVERFHHALAQSRKARHLRAVSD